MLTSVFFHQKSSTFVISRNTDIVSFQYIIANSFNFFESIKVVLINMVAALIMSAKLVAVSVLIIKVFWNSGHDVIISIHDASK